MSLNVQLVGEKALTDYIKYRYLNRKIRKILTETLEVGESTAKANLAHIDTGETLNSIHTTYRQLKNSFEGELSAGGHSVWIEFGTGVKRNAGTEHPWKNDFALSKWGTYGDGHGRDPQGWWYPPEQKHTYGIRMNHFMLDAYNAMLNNLKKYGRGGNTE